MIQTEISAKYALIVWAPNTAWMFSPGCSSGAARSRILSRIATKLS